MADPVLTLAATRAVLDPAGALWLPDERTLVVADLHLEKASSHARRRTFLPPYDTRSTLLALSHLVARRDPARVVCLGDSFHDVGGPDRLGAEGTLIAALQRGRDWVWVTGNHDPQVPAHVGGTVAGTLTIGGLTLRHEPVAGASAGEVAGHLHPAAKVVRHGRSVRGRAFVTDGERLVLPAFGVLTGGLNVLDRAFARLFAHARPKAYVIGRRRIYAIGPGALLPD